MCVNEENPELTKVTGHRETCKLGTKCLWRAVSRIIHKNSDCTDEKSLIDTSTPHCSKAICVKLPENQITTFVGNATEIQNIYDHDIFQCSRIRLRTLPVSLKKICIQIRGLIKVWLHIPSSTLFPQGK